jgi:hypothetical protein
MDKDKDKRDSDRHLTDAELFGLAAPAAGEPEALPPHLSTCQACSRALHEWKASVRDLAAEEVDEIERRSPAEWQAAEEATMAAIRRAARPGRRSHPLRWVVGIAATLAVIALAMPPRRGTSVAAAVPTPAAEAGLSPADRADDDLLRQASYLAGGGDEVSEVESEGSL